MKKFVFLFAVAAMFAFVACSDSKNAEKAETFQHNINPADLEQFHDQWNGEGVNGTQVVIACDNHFVYTPSDLHWEGEYRSFCIYKLQNVTPQTAADLNGCYNVVNGKLVSESDGSRPGITLEHDKDTIYSARVSNPTNIRADFQPYLTPCHADIFKLCFDTVAHRVVAYFKDHHNNEGQIEGDWWGGRQRDTLWRTERDTIVIRERDTIYRYVVDTLIQGGDTTVYTYFIIRRHKNWDGAISGGFLYGTDSVYLVQMDANGAVINTWGDTYRHRTPVSYNVPSVMPATVEGNCYAFSGATANCAGTSVNCNLGTTQVVGPVVLNGMDITNYLQGCQPYVQKICFGSLTNGNGSWTIFVMGPEGEQAATITGTYHTNSNPPADTTTQVVLTHTSSSPNGVYNGGNGILYQESNTKTTIYYVNGTEVRRSSVNFGGRAPYQYVENGTFTAAMTNVTVPFVGNTATLVGGYALTVTPGAMYTVPSGFMAELQQLGCSHQHDSLATSQTGLTIYGHWSCPGHTDVVTTYFIPKTPADTIPTPPDTTVDLTGHLDWIYISDSYTGNGYSLSTWVVGMWTMSDGTHQERWAPLYNCGQASAWSSETVTAARYTVLAGMVSDTNFALAHITSFGAPTEAGYLVHNSDHTIGDYWWTTADGIARVHCNIGGYGNDWNGHNPIHFRNTTGGTVHINETVHGVTVNHTFQ